MSEEAVIRIVPDAPPDARGLSQDEPLLFARAPSGCGVDMPDAPEGFAHLGALARRAPLRLPGLSEPEVMRHFVRLSQKNYSIDTGIFPLGSCTMKHNPRQNEALARLPGFAQLHPLQPQATTQGMLALMETLADWLCVLTGMASVALSPRAGAHGELCGMMAIRAALAARGEADTRRRILVPSSAHGTNPATAALGGYQIESVPAGADGRVRAEDVKARLGADIAAIMITNPNTCGLFEREICEITNLVHEAGGYVYCDGANFNAIMGRVRPGDLGMDAMHINLHKTFSTPHGGGGPGAGPVVFSDALAPFAPVPFLTKSEGGLRLVETMEEARSLGFKPSGRMASFHGQGGTFVRALGYMMSMGGDGLRQAADDAVLNANYILASLRDCMSAPFDGPCMHEALFDETFLDGTGLGTLDFAKAMIDEGVHPMTIYFPLVVRGAMLIEPTETESRASLDAFIRLMRGLVAKAKAGDGDAFHRAPEHAPRRRLDETKAAREPVLRWKE